MQEKQVVQFSPLPVYYYKTDYLTYCKACHTYNIHDGKPCYKCGSTKDFTTLEAIAYKTVQKDFFNRTCFIFIVYAVLFLLSMKFSNIIGVSIFTFLCLGIHFLIYKGFKKYLVMKEFEEHITLNTKEINKDLNEILKRAEIKIEKEAYLEAYEDLRYLGMVMDRKSIRNNKIMCLKEFRLRSDLPLEMKEVLIGECNRYLIYYIYEVAQIKKELIDEQTIDYILRCKGAIMEFPEGRKIVATVVEASLKSKMLTNKYAKELYDSIDYLPKERIVRLCKIKNCIVDENVRGQIVDRIKLKYGYDEAIDKYL